MRTHITYIVNGIVAWLFPNTLTTNDGLSKVVMPPSPVYHKRRTKQRQKEKQTHRVNTNKNSRKQCDYDEHEYDENDEFDKASRPQVQLSTTLQEQIYAWAVALGNNNSVTRQCQRTCGDLRAFDSLTELNRKGFDLQGQVMCCYGCNRFINCATHPVYVFSCNECGTLFQEYRHLSRDLTGQVAVVVGARTKLGHQIVVKLLLAGATVIGTTRFPERARELYQDYPEYQEWKERLTFYPSSFDLDVPDIAAAAALFARWLPGGIIDVLVCCAAQTIRVREKGVPLSNTVSDAATNRYQDARYVDSRDVNSWQMKIPDLRQTEMEEVFRINAIAPCLLVQQWEPLLQNSKENPYIINVHAREGLFQVRKSSKHIHTNMAKAGLAMLTKGLIDTGMTTHTGKKFFIHGCDPGWISVDEYYEDTRPWIVPPLDEIDGAARILFPVMKGLVGSCSKTRRHFHHLLY